MRISTLNKSILVLSLLLVLGVAGCGGGSGPSFEIPTDPEAASQTNLESLFSQISLQLQSAKPGSDKATELSTQLATVGGELAKRAAAVVRTRLSEAGRADGRVPLGAVERELASLDTVKRWDMDVYSSLSTELTTELEATQRTIKEQEAKLETTPRTDVLDRLKLLSELSALSGSGSEEMRVTTSVLWL